MADVVGAIYKRCRNYSIEKPVDQFYALRSPRRPVVNCLDCRNQLRGERSTSV
ncbi:hypothetical protein B0T26DRAFT_700641 [Lasiosphaeria miniovina]|uniref:Uncharacterized protein n=1 Tax=Lasiosphaeria miniovina TaxID=1954250 RepID=A0AA40E461_9PEZI|nr:uncharacterized protein B0T26DRAFT_700641 [Lasiosphaeria miniovina]KAK0721908.1 hypothetical protein B0T26DRAFT_700641 [Lasiosphaeria miniovina]